ncbi:MAG: hypothetical protein LBE18_06205, partial [Planctomycetaceae bacterium]|nr:hypothetical protein [Planctomycetaceae bacterium]
KEKEHFKLFDFFANCEYFEEKYNYDEVLKLPIGKNSSNEFKIDDNIEYDKIEIADPDKVKTITEMQIGIE